MTAAVRHGREIVGIWPGLHEQAVGLAVDIGSTTIAAHLCDLATGEVLASSGVMNPQIRFGEDLMSRVSYVMMNPGGDVEMTAAVREAIDELAGAVTREAGLAADDILEMTVVGNPIMHHLFLGLDPTELGGAPFALAIDGAYEARASAFGLPLSSGAHVYVLPCIAGHVGADAAGVVLSEGAVSATTSWRWSSMSAPTPRSCSATATGCSPAPRRPARLSRARRSHRASAPRPAPSSASASTRRRSSRASR